MSVMSSPCARYWIWLWWLQSVSKKWVMFRW